MTKHNFEGSSSIRACEYHDEENAMTIHFLSGGSHKYEGVTKAHFDAFTNAPSPGKHFHQYIRPHFKSKKL